MNVLLHFTDGRTIEREFQERVSRVIIPELLSTGVQDPEDALKEGLMRLYDMDRWMKEYADKTITKHLFEYEQTIGDMDHYRELTYAP